ncbi:uncharacterized protein LOC107492843 [Arachis duranensis]|uniref:Uncharacterized protein LOC107492843 n=1 Tax=Arachis duranensis TaxID=130453 RepID=A0A9C6TRL8_ARADU|nr:uncharacterized protein LOC107492843 [Arachis duranensis]
MDMHLSANNLSFLAELLSFYKFPGEEIPIVRGSALSALQGTNEELGKKAILKLMDAVDAYISDPVRQLDNRKCFLYSDEKVLNKVQEGSLPKAITSFIQHDFRVSHQIAIESTLANADVIPLYYCLLSPDLSAKKQGSITALEVWRANEAVESAAEEYLVSHVNIKSTLSFSQPSFVTIYLQHAANIIFVTIIVIVINMIEGFYL